MWVPYPLIRLNIEINVQISFHSSNISCGYLLNAANRAVKKMDGHSRPHGFIVGDLDWKQWHRVGAEREDCAGEGAEQEKASRSDRAHGQCRSTSREF